MVSERGHGIQLFCSINRSEDQSSTSTTTPDDFFTGSGSTLEGESETSGITWFRRDEDSDEWEAISEDHVTLSEDGRKSALYIKEADAEHGDYRYYYICVTSMYNFMLTCYSAGVSSAEAMLNITGRFSPTSSC